jgi:hypothetical protein
MNEVYVCYNCGNYGPLTIHLRCGACNSDAVALATTGTKILQVREEGEKMADWAVRFVDNWLGPQGSPSTKLLKH